MADSHDTSTQAGPANRFEEGLERLRASGCRVTPQRKAILALFQDDPEHLTPQTIFGRLEGSVPSLSLATVYNTLELFEEVGLVNRFNGHDGQTYFDPTLEPHHHAVCGGCGEIFDVQIEANAIRQLIEKSQTLHDDDAHFSVDQASVWLRGICAACKL